MKKYLISLGNVASYMMLFAGIFLCAGDCDNSTMFVLSKLAGIALFGGAIFVLKKLN